LDDFEDRHVTFAEWPAEKPKTPFGGMPTLLIDGKLISQCNAILRYYGKQTGLYPQDNFEALLVDEILYAVEDVLSKIGATMTLNEEDKKKLEKRLLMFPGLFG